MLRSGALFGAFGLLLGRVLLHTMTFARISKACDEDQKCDLYLGTGAQTVSHSVRSHGICSRLPRVVGATRVVLASWRVGKR